MGPCNQVQAIDMAEITGHFGAEYPSCSSGVDCPVLDVFGVGPHEITERTLVRDLNSPVDGSDLVDGLDLWGEAAVDAQDLAVNDCSQRQIIKYFSAVFPRVGVAILSVDLVEEAVHLGDLPGLVVAS